ncbi:outer membrane protein assembly factor BamE [Emcibacter nanhaiensis]|uniref:Outer membrane protein assembly factor BamE n=1 Tax=Emcibacter nanhaiensis TaxID=1505037 RepID=A0A501PRD3_9PROT|nr:outer membrane protein assembly factor BamE [Emcibacter nanhaiensis]TPD62718.1 outer membrane protein assembly factor BamE [Emcibacter nanhaiensis]
MKISLKTLFIVLTAATLVSACSPRKEVRGYMADEKLVSAIRPNVDTQNSVKSMLGSPTTVATFDNLSWYYYTKSSEQFAFFDQDITELDIIAVRFNEDGYVTSVDKYNLADFKDIDPVGDKTKTYGRELSFFQELFANIGRFGTSGPQTPRAGN